MYAITYIPAGTVIVHEDNTLGSFNTENIGTVLEQWSADMLLPLLKNIYFTSVQQTPTNELHALCPVST